MKYNTKGEYTALQKITNAVMLPVYAAAMTSYFSFIRPNVAYAQEKPAAAAEAPKFDSTVDCLVYKIENPQTNCDKPVETVPETQPALPSQAAPSTTGTLEAKVGGETTSAAGSASPAQYAPKKKNSWKTIGQILKYGAYSAIAYYGIIKPLTKNKSSPTAPVTPAGGSSSGLDSGDANDPSLDNSVKGDESAQDDVTTIKVK